MKIKTSHGHDANRETCAFLGREKLCGAMRACFGPYPNAGVSDCGRSFPERISFSLRGPNHTRVEDYENKRTGERTAFDSLIAAAVIEAKCIHMCVLVSAG
jgi:hypothetical protein